MAIIAILQIHMGWIRYASAPRLFIIPLTLAQNIHMKVFEDDTVEYVKAA